MRNLPTERGKPRARCASPEHQEQGSWVWCGLKRKKVETAAGPPSRHSTLSPKRSPRPHYQEPTNNTESGERRASFLLYPSPAPLHKHPHEGTNEPAKLILGFSGFGFSSLACCPSKHTRRHKVTCFFCLKTHSLGQMSGCVIDIDNFFSVGNGIAKHAQER